MTDSKAETAVARLAVAEAKIEGIVEKIDEFKADLNKRLDRQDAALTRVTTFMDRHQGGVATLVALGALSGLVTSVVAFVSAKATGIIK